MVHLARIDLAASNALTRQQLRWNPTGRTCLTTWATLITVLPSVNRLGLTTAGGCLRWIGHPEAPDTSELLCGGNALVVHVLPEIVWSEPLK
jgi:hypothetical protein